MHKLFSIFFLFVLLFCSCKKPKENTPVPASPSIASNPPPVLVCEDLPKEPPVGWTDSTADENKNINAFLFNPANADEIIYIANGDIFGYNKMFTYNIPAQKESYLSDNGNYLPQANKNGWIVFSRADLNVYKMKSNGDSLTQLTTNSLCHNPQWDYTGKNIVYFENAHGITLSAFVKTDAKGKAIDYAQGEIPGMATARTKNAMAFLKESSGTVLVYYKDWSVNSETLIISMPSVSSSSPQLTFNNLTFDNNDENLFWSTGEGIFMCNMETKKITQLFKSCETLIYNRPIIAHGSEELTYSCHLIKQIDPKTLLHTYKTFQMNLRTKVIREVKVFPS